MKKLVVILFLLLALVPSYARHFLEVGARVGLAGLTYQTDYGSTIPGYHAAMDVGYLYKSPYWLAFRVGATVETASSSYRKAHYEDAYTVTDVENETMTVQYNIGVLRERHYSYTVSFPLQLGFHIQRFTFLVGPRITLPLYASYKQTVSDAALSIYYPKYNNLVEESYPMAASRSFGMEGKGDIKLPTYQWSLAGELTYDFLISSQYGKAEHFISVGLYFDAGLTYSATYPNYDRYGILRLTDTRDGFPLTRYMTPVLEAWREEKPLVAKFGSFDVGVKVAYRLTSAPRQKRTAHGCNCDE